MQWEGCPRMWCQGGDLLETKACCCEVVEGRWYRPSLCCPVSRGAPVFRPFTRKWLAKNSTEIGLVWQSWDRESNLQEIDGTYKTYGKCSVGEGVENSNLPVWEMGNAAPSPTINWSRLVYGVERCSWSSSLVIWWLPPESRIHSDEAEAAGRCAWWAAGFLSLFGG